MFLFIWKSWLQQPQIQPQNYTKDFCHVSDAKKKKAFTVNCEIKEQFCQPWATNLTVAAARGRRRKRRGKEFGKISDGTRKEHSEWLIPRHLEGDRTATASWRRRAAVQVDPSHLLPPADNAVTFALAVKDKHSHASLRISVQISVRRPDSLSLTGDVRSGEETRNGRKKINADE